MRNLLLLTAISVFAIPCHCPGQVRDEYKAMVLPILDALRSSHLSGSLRYSGLCDNRSDAVRRDFPRVTIPSTYSAPPLQVLREMFANDEKMRVMQESDGTVRMAETDVPEDILNVRITHISFDEELRKGGIMYAPGFVLRFILAAPEVVTFMKDNGIEMPGRVIREIADPGWPHISGELNNVTLSEALDYMLKTFPGLWVYENCPGNAKSKRVVIFAFYPTGQRPAGHQMQNEAHESCVKC